MTTKVTPDLTIGHFRKNAIINGDFNVWQRGTSFAAIATDTYSADRWAYVKLTTGAAHTVSRSTDVPTVAQAGRLFNYSILVDCTTADAAVAAGDLVILQQKIEGYNWLPLAQRAITLSFWVKATKTGTYCVNARNSGSDRSYVGEYTVNVTDAWEKKTVTFTASSSAGTWDYTNGIGLQLGFTLMAGTTYQTTAGAWQTGNFFATANQVNACDDVANNFRIAGVQLEAGSVATEFETRTFHDELALCQRYYNKTFNYDVVPAHNSSNAGAIHGKGVNSSDTEPFANWVLPVAMRAIPTVTLYSIAGGGTNGQWTNGSGISTANARAGGVGVNEKVIQLDNTGNVSGNSGAQFYIHATASAEL